MTQPTADSHKILSGIDMERLRPMLHRYCTRMVGSAIDGEDLVQEALLRALEAGLPLEPVHNPEGWLFRIAHNLALDFLRRRARRADTHSEDDVDQIVHPIDEQARRDAAAATLPTFMHMPATQRSVVILFDVLEYSAEEVGEILGTTVPAVKSSLQRGRIRLRELAGRADTPSPHTALAEADQQLLRRYVDLFNARDFDALRTLLAADVELDLVTRPHRRGAAVGEYFTQYGRMQGWKAWAGVVEGRPAVLMQQTEREDAQPDYFVLLDFASQQVTAIQDFYYARYAIADAAPRALWALHCS